MTANPLISIVIPVYNAEKYLEEALESVFAQTYRPIEVICVDDKSTDGSLKILSRYGDRITLLENHRNLGIGETRNRGIVQAKGTFLSFMDADDRWEPGKLSRQIELFKQLPTIDICFGYMCCFISPDANEETKRVRYCNPEPMPGHIAATSLIRMESFKRVGLFGTNWNVGEFIDWMQRARECGLSSYTVPEVFLLRRIHDTNTVVTKRTDYADYLRIARESLVRKKKL